MQQGFRATLFHNPNCGTSRQVLARLREGGFDVEVVEYLRVGWERSHLEHLIEAIGLGARGVLRAKEALLRAPALLEPDVPDDRLIAAMIDRPALVERPIVATPLGVVLARPPERVRAVLPASAT